jgi:hypothetical protein
VLNNYPGIQHLIGRKLSFYPPIQNICCDDWTLKRITWSELLISNVHTKTEFAIPRSFIGAISLIDDPIVRVALNRRLGIKRGRIVPLQRRVIEFPVAGDSSIAQTPVPGGPAEIIGIRLEPDPAKRFARVTSLVLLAGAACTLILGFATK